MKREARILLTKATDSLFLAVDHFNRPHDRGRKEAVLIFMDRAFELLLKAAILHRGGAIREGRDKNTLGFDKCVRKSISDQSLKILTEEEALTIQTINGLRDGAQHHVIDLSENHLYLYAQSGLTLFRKLVFQVFQSKLSSFFPERVLPITTEPPLDLGAIINAEFKHIKGLLAPGSRQRVAADAA